MNKELDLIAHHGLTRESNTYCVHFKIARVDTDLVDKMAQVKYTRTMDLSRGYSLIWHAKIPTIRRIKFSEKTRIKSHEHP